MNGNPFQPVTSGQPSGNRLTRDWFNAATAAAQANKRARHTFGSPSLGVPDGTVLVKNNSGSDVDRFGVLGIDDILISPDDNLESFKDQDAFIGVTPTKASHTGLYVIAWEPIPKDAIGWAYAYGVCTVQVNIDLEGDDTADVANSDRTQLESGPIGSAQILWVESPGTGTKWAKVRIGNGGLPAFPVTLSNEDGSFGSNDPPAQADLTYTVHHAKTGRFIADDVPVWKARQYGHVSPARKGYCDLIGGVTYIVDHDEVIDAGACS
jgi:hypothetical protein